jgi:hypothetical protein
MRDSCSADSLDVKESGIFAASDAGVAGALIAWNVVKDTPAGGDESAFGRATLGSWEDT